MPGGTEQPLDNVVGSNEVVSDSGGVEHSEDEDDIGVTTIMFGLNFVM